MYIAIELKNNQFKPETPKTQITMKTKILKAAKKAGYIHLVTDSLPGALEKILLDKGINKAGGSYLKDLVFYRGDIDTTEDWLIVFDHGWYYKVGAEFMIWYYQSADKEFVGRACWSLNHLVNGLLEFFKDGKISRDPDYQT